MHGRHVSWCSRKFAVPEDNSLLCPDSLLALIDLRSSSVGCCRVWDALGLVKEVILAVDGPQLDTEALVVALFSSLQVSVLHQSDHIWSSGFDLVCPVPLVVGTTLLADCCIPLISNADELASSACRLLIVLDELHSCCMLISCVVDLFGVSFICTTGVTNTSCLCLFFIGP